MLRRLRQLFLAHSGRKPATPVLTVCKIRLCAGARLSLRTALKTSCLSTSALLLFCLLFLPSPPVRAAGGVTIGPAMKEVTIAPQDDEVTFELTLRNNNETTVTAHLRALDFKALDESGGVAFTGLRADENSAQYGLSSWLTFNKDTVVIAPGQTEKVTAIVTNRDSLGPGGHYGAIVVTPDKSEDAVDANRVEILPALSTLVLAKKLGGERYDLKLNSTSFDKSGLSFPGKVTLRFQNDGNVHVVPRGTVIIRDPLGKEVSKTNINADSGVILPQSFRKYPNNLSSLARAWLPGRYQVEINWRYDGKEETTSTSASFWYIGWGAYLLVLAMLIIVGCLWITGRKRSRNSVGP